MVDRLFHLKIVRNWVHREREIESIMRKMPWIKATWSEFFAKLQNHIYKLQRGRPKKTVEWACVQLIQKTLMYMTWLYKRVIKWERMCETLVRQWQWQWQSVWLQNHSRLFCALVQSQKQMTTATTEMRSWRKKSTGIYMKCSLFSTITLWAMNFIINRERERKKNFIYE